MCECSIVMSYAQFKELKSIISVGDMIKWTVKETKESKKLLEIADINHYSFDSEDIEEDYKYQVEGVIATINGIYKKDGETMNKGTGLISIVEPLLYLDEKSETIYDQQLSTCVFMIDDFVVKEMRKEKLELLVMD